MHATLARSARIRRRPRNHIVVAQLDVRGRVQTERVPPPRQNSQGQNSGWTEIGRHLDFCDAEY